MLKVQKVWIYSLIFFALIAVAAIYTPAVWVEHNDTVDKPFQKVMSDYQLRKDFEAIPFDKQQILNTLNTSEKKYGPNHPAVAIGLIILGSHYELTGEYAKAEPLYKRYLAILEKTVGPDHLMTAISLNNLAVLYSKLGDYTKAEPLYKRTIAIKEKALGPDHPNVAKSLDSLMGLYLSTGEYNKAESLGKRALNIKKKALGPDHPDMANSLNNLAEFYRKTGEYAKAEPLYKRALAIREKALGPDHPDVANSLNNLAEFYSTTGEYTKAEPLQKRALAILEKALGPDHPNVANSLNNSALLYYSLGDYTNAEPLFNRALSIREKALGPDHPSTANSLNSLAKFYKTTGEYAKAEPLYKRALAIREKALGPDHPDVASSLNSLAEFYRITGEYAKAEPLYKRALAIREKALGPDHPDVAIILNNSALLYFSLGDYTQAEPLYKRALAIQEKALGPDHPDTATCLHNLAGLYYRLSDYTNAELLYKRALAIQEKALGLDHPDTANSLNSLAVLYSEFADYTKAEPLYKRALSIREKALGPDHHSTANSLNSLASLYFEFADYTKAEPLYKRALSIREKALGPDHPDTINSLIHLAILYSTLGHYAKAHHLFMQQQTASEKNIDQVMRFTSENQKIKFLATQKNSMELCFSLVAFYMQADNGAIKDILDIWLRRKGIILETQKRYQESLVDSDNPELVKVFQNLSIIRGQLSKLYFNQFESNDIGVLKKKIAMMENQKEGLEAELAKLSQSFSLHKILQRANSEKVASALPDKTVLLEIAKINRANFKIGKNEKKWLPPHYLVFVLHAGKPDEVSLIDLGPADAIDMAIQELKQQIQTNHELQANKKLYEMVFAKIKPKLDQSKEIFISPDSNLNLVPFEILQDPNGRFLIEDYTFNYLSAGRDLIGRGKMKGNFQKSLLIGDPDFDLGIYVMNAKTQKNETPSNRLLLGKRSTEMDGIYFHRLPGTLEEVQSISQIIGQNKCEVKIGSAATEQALFQVKAPKILHIASHGFFLNDQELSVFSNDRGAFIRSPLKNKVSLENPLIRSGIALAGANNALKLKSNDESQGLFTAEKVLGLQLIGTELVVLSACDTGVGEVQNGEGVYGLRRAFVQAGTKSLVMSMWKVPDTETKELMVQFYKNIKSGMNRCQALRQAALHEKKIVKKRYGKDKPSYWGAFLFLGES